MEILKRRGDLFERHIVLLKRHIAILLFQKSHIVLFIEAQCHIQISNPDLI